MKKIVLSLLFCFSVLGSALYAQNSYDMRIHEVRELMRKEDYETAKAFLSEALKETTYTSSQKQSIRNLINQCNQEIGISRLLSVRHKNFDKVSYKGGKDSTYVDVHTKHKWYLRSEVTWCVAKASGNDVILLEFEPNLAHESREGYVEVSVDNANKSYIHVSQAGRPETKRNVSITTHPRNASKEIDGSHVDGSIMLTAGEYHVKIHQQTYEELDTTLVIKDDNNTRPLEITYNLRPKFTILSLDIKAADSLEVISPTIMIDNEPLSKTKSAVSLDDESGVAFGHLYFGNEIPVESKKHYITVSHKGYDTYAGSFDAPMGEIIQKEIILTPKTGILKITDTYGAEGADILIDDKKYGTAPIDSLKVKVGEHRVTFRKQNMLSVEDYYNVAISVGQTTELQVAMVPYDSVMFHSPSCIGADLYINDELVGVTPMLRNMRQGTYHIRFEKPGFLTVSEDLRITGQEGTVHFAPEMLETTPLKISVDDPGLYFTVTDKTGKTIATSHDNPASVNIPVSSTPYKIQFYQQKKGNKKVYRGKLRFKDTRKDSRKYQAWSPYIFNFVSAEYFPSSGNDVATVGNGSNLAGYNHMFDAQLFKLQLFKGLSTSLIRSKFYMPQVQGQKVSILPSTTVIDAPAIMPGLTCILLNGELRMGGALCQYLDADVIASYAWYPDMTKFLPLTHMSGHDLFVGAEVSSRVRLGTLHFKFGYQMLFNGSAHLYSTQISEGPYTPTEKKFINTDANLSKLGGQLTFGIGLSIGTWKTKGNNILRIW